MPTAAAPTGEIEIPREPELQETAEEVTRNTVADHREPGLMDTPHMQPEPPSAFGRAPGISAAPSPAPEVAPVENHGPVEALQPETVPIESEPVARPALAVVSDSEFEARVAAAMAAYSRSAEPKGTSEAHEVAEGASQPEASPSVESPTVTAPEIHVAGHSTPVSISEPAEEIAVNHDSVAAGVEEAIPQVAAAAAAATGAEHETIAQAVHRVMERIKGDLVEEIVRELKSKK